MGIPKKGFRKIVVNDEVFFWKFQGKILVSPEYSRSDHLLYIDFGYYDVWAYINTDLEIPPDYSPRKVTPKFVSESIKFALANGWKKGKYELQFRDNKYIICN